MIRLPRASVVIPSRGGRDRLPYVLAAFEHQTEPDFEVIVVVDGDVDDSAGYLATVSTSFPLSSIVFPENRGRPAALNAGFGRASGDVLIRCDDDLEVEPEFVATLCGYHGNEPTGVIGMCQDIFRPRTRYAEVYGIAADAEIRRVSPLIPADRAWRAWSAVVAVTRDTYDRVGPYDERYRRYGWEDVDWGYRAHLAGVRIVVEPATLALHHNPPLTTRERTRKALASGASRRTFEQIHGVGVLSGERLDASAWNVLVQAMARVLNDRTVGALAGSVDLAIRVLPRWPANKLVALLVEAAGQASAR